MIQDPYIGCSEDLPLASIDWQQLFQCLGRDRSSCIFQQTIYWIKHHSSILRIRSTIEIVAHCLYFTSNLKKFMSLDQ